MRMMHWRGDVKEAVKEFCKSLVVAAFFILVMTGAYTLLNFALGRPVVWSN